MLSENFNNCPEGMLISTGQLPDVESDVEERYPLEFETVTLPDDLHFSGTLRTEMKKYL